MGSGALPVATLVAAFAVIMGVAALPLFRWADAPPSETPARVSTLDGLRGILAIGVYLSHASQMRHFDATGRWELGASPLFDALGPGAVATFFMITGYLFWGKVLRDGALDWGRMLIGRVFRIGPTYAVAFAAVLLSVAIATHGTLRDPPLRFARDVASWSALGIGPEFPLDGYRPTWMILLGVTWSLRWEWGFYFLLPLLAALLGETGRSRVALLAVLPFAAVVTHLTGMSWPNLLVAFAAGMFAATFRRARPSPRAERLSSVAALGAVGLTACLPAFHTADGWIRLGPVFLLGVAFFFVSSGASVFGILTSRAAKRLGDVSYPIYLLQGLVLIPFWTTEIGRRLITADLPVAFLVILAGAVALVAIATLVHAVVERPGIAWGGSVIARLPRRARPVPAADLPA